MASAFDYFDPEQSKRIDDFADRARESVEDIRSRREADSGVNQRTPGLITTSSNSPITYGLSNKDMIEAIDRRALKSYQAAMMGLKSKIQLDAETQRLNKLYQAAQLTAAEIQYNERVRANREARRENRRRARGAVLGNILGIAGAVVGGVAGGPAGVMAGYGVGQGVGGMAGSGGFS